ncbi:MAG: hypothetical protein QNJ54_25395 [Prochloraceae cyanobacterium]|nr:hypothetical protein [Prochloraceae cyanobacterium]
MITAIQENFYSDKHINYLNAVEWKLWIPLVEADFNFQATSIFSNYTSKFGYSITFIAVKGGEVT